MTKSLEERVRALEDEREIFQVIYMYGHALDYGYEADWTNCWAEDAGLYWPPTGWMKGHAEITAAFRAHTHAPEAAHKHMVINPLIRIEGDRAVVDSMFTRMDPYDGVPELRVFGRYRDVMVRCEDGRWRFQERKVEIEAWRPGGRPTVDAAEVKARVNAEQ